MTKAAVASVNRPSQEQTPEERLPLQTSAWQSSCSGSIMILVNSNVILLEAWFYCQFDQIKQHYNKVQFVLPC